MSELRMISFHLTGDALWQRMERAVQKVQERLERTAAALEQAGVPPFALQSAEQQLRHLGRPRAERLYDWLLEVNVGMKGGSPLPERTLLERFIVRLARKE